MGVVGRRREKYEGLVCRREYGSVVKGREGKDSVVRLKELLQ